MNQSQDESARGSSQGQWEREALSRLATAALAEQRRSRRWGILFKSLALLYAFALLFLFLNVEPLVGREDSTEPHAAVVDIDGVIMRGSDADADRVATGMRRAFQDAKTQAVILRINSPGGSPVQSGMIYREIMRLRAKYPDIPVYAVAGDVMASGAYYIAAAADQIYVDPASMVGSIGVIFGGFGFEEAMERLGIERRVYTSGENKALLDPFLPEDEDQVAHMHGLIDEVHRQFIDAVREGRGDRLSGDEDELFSGLVWTGTGAIERGLADEVGSAGQVARDVVGVENTRDFTSQRPFFERLTERMGAGIASGLREHVAPAFR
jgi:protease IV